MNSIHQIKGLPQRKVAVICILILLFQCIQHLHANDAVVLLHGLARSSGSMDKLQSELQREGFVVLNIDYPSRKFTIEELSEQVRSEIADLDKAFDRVHFVTHSMGGILLRYIQYYYPLDNMGRAVMLSPPNKGSEVVDALSGWNLFSSFNGPAGQQLGTGDDSLPRGLGPVDFKVGVITGDRSINWILSMLIPGKDDGKVSMESAKVSGMQAFKVVHATHPYIMKRSLVIRDVIAFLQTGEFTEARY